MNLSKLYTVRDVPDAARLNADILAEFEAGRESPVVWRTHFFAGRYENLYLPLEQVPALKPILGFAEATARELLGDVALQLRSGFWFNLMQPGEVTQPHCHDENDELLSAAYYVSVPPRSGDLLLHTATGRVRVEPQAGRLVLFSPALVHEVERNLSDSPRLSVGINIGPADS